MSIQDEMNSGAIEYAKYLEKRRETERLDALRLEAQKHSNASAFAQAFEAALNKHDTDNTDIEEN